tara:strand:- start:1670 stop:1954 length:285 start_codon:yes stop_codon:yes gene_type:complete
MFRNLFGEKIDDHKKKKNLKNKLNKLLTNEIKEKLWIKYYEDNFNVSCYYCKRRNINPFSCYWVQLNHMDHQIEDNMIPVCEYCDIIDDSTILI